MNDPKTSSKRKISLLQLFLLQAVVLLYTTSGIFAKLASAESFLSFSFFLFYGMEIVVLGIYAILWQQLIKRIDLSFAYANKATALLWSMLWAYLIFHEQITVQNLIGVALVLVGTAVVNSDHA